MGRHVVKALCIESRRLPGPLEGSVETIANIPVGATAAEAASSHEP